MKVDININHQDPEADSRSSESIEVSNQENKYKILIVQDEPEDMIFGRSLPSVEEIVPMLRMAYDAGVKGENLVINYID